MDKGSQMDFARTQLAKAQMKHADHLGRISRNDLVDWFVRHGVGRKRLQDLFGKPAPKWGEAEQQRLAAARSFYIQNQVETVEELIDFLQKIA